MDIIITVPKSIKWVNYEKELEVVKDGDMIISFKVANKPNCKVGDKCYVVYDGFIRGWMNIVGINENSFDCTTTGERWEGIFIERSGIFNYIEPIPMKGFQGYRYYK